MKIQVVKQGNSKIKAAIASCPFFVDNPDGADLRKPAKQ